MTDASHIHTDPAITPSTPLKGLPLSVIDTETTGLPPCEIVEFCILRADFSTPWVEVPEAFYLGRVKPTIPIHPKATEVHGIRARDVAMCPAWGDLAARSFPRWIAGSVPMAFNAPFDFGVIAAQQRKAGEPVPTWPWLDPLVWARAMWGPSGNRLAEVAARLSIDPGKAHSTYDDAVTCHAIARPLLVLLIKEGGAPVMRTLGELLTWQVAEAVRQEAAAPAHHDKPWTKWANARP